MMRVLIAGTSPPLPLASDYPDASVEVVAGDFLHLWSRYGNAAFDLVVSNALDLVQDWPACIENLIYVAKRLEVVSKNMSNADLARLCAMAAWEYVGEHGGRVVMQRPKEVSTDWAGWKCNPRHFYPSAQDATFVLARWNEDVSWASQYRHFVVQKDEHLPNLGREASSYLWYIVENYHRLSGVYVFTQARPDHLDFSLLREPVNGFRWLGEPKYPVPEDGSPWGLPVARLATDLDLQVDWPARCAQGGTFAVTAETIQHRRPKSFYRCALKLALEIDASPWLYETMWEQVFLARRQPLTNVRASDAPVSDDVCEPSSSA